MNDLAELAMNWWSIGISAGTLVTGLIGAAIGHWLGYQRAKNEKIWDLKRQAYSAILFALSKSMQVCDVADSYIEEDEMRYFHEPVSQEHNKRIMGYMDTANDRFSSDYIVLSTEFVELYEGLDLKLQSGDRDATPDEEHKYFCDVLREMQPKLLAQARDEISQVKIPFLHKRKRR